MLVGDPVELAGRDPRLELLADVGDRLGDDPPGRGHLRDLLRGLADDHLAATVAKASSTSENTSSTVLLACSGTSLPVVAVVLDHRLGLLVVDREPRAIVSGVSSGPPLLVGAPERAPPSRRLVVEVEEEDHVEAAADLAQHPVERLGLGEVAREAVEDEALDASSAASRSRIIRIVISSGTRSPRSMIAFTSRPSGVASSSARNMSPVETCGISCSAGSASPASLPRPLRAEHQRSRWPAW